MAKIENLRAAVEKLEAEVRDLEKMASKDGSSNSINLKLVRTREVLHEVRRIYYVELKKRLSNNGGSVPDDSGIEPGPESAA